MQFLSGPQKTSSVSTTKYIFSRGQFAMRTIKQLQVKLMIYNEKWKACKTAHSFLLLSCNGSQVTIWRFFDEWDMAQEKEILRCTHSAQPLVLTSHSQPPRLVFPILNHGRSDQCLPWDFLQTSWLGEELIWSHVYTKIQRQRRFTKYFQGHSS